jgi:hypothetical protein
MKALQSMFAALSALLAAFTLICGIWIRFEATAGADAASAEGFFLYVAAAAFAFVLATAAVTLLRNREGH